MSNIEHNRYTKTVWTDEQTEMSADNFNKIEEGIYRAFCDIILAENNLLLLLKAGTTNTSKRAEADAEGNIITDTYATKQEDLGKLPMGDGTGMQQMFDDLKLNKDLIAKKIKHLSENTSITFNSNFIQLDIQDNDNAYQYVFNNQGKLIKTTNINNVETSKEIHLELLEWLHNYIREVSNTLEITNVSIKTTTITDAIIEFTNKPARNTWTVNSKAPATQGDIVVERNDIDATFTTKNQLNLLLKTGTTDTAKKAEADSDGYNIKTKYATKDELNFSDQEQARIIQALLDNLDLKYNSTNGVQQLVHYTDKANDVYTVLGSIDLPTEFTLNRTAGKNYYDATNKEIVMTFNDVNETQIRIPVTNLVDVYNPVATSTITITISQADSITHERTISASINLGSITKQMLAVALQAELNEALDGEYGKSSGNTPANPATGSRMANENIRKSNETTRQTNEETRQDNETARQVAEYGGLGYTPQSPATGSRVANENVRQANETARQNAETQRASDHTAWDTKINTTYANIISGYWQDLLALWTAKDSDIDSALTTYKNNTTAALQADFNTYKTTTNNALDSKVASAVNTYTATIEAWKATVNNILGIDSNLDATLDTLAEIIAYIKEADNSSYATLIAHVQANTQAASDAQTDINNHKNNTNNPHNVTATQTGAVSYSATQNLTSEQKAKAKTNLGLGSAADKTAGSNAGNVPVLDSNGKLPTSTYNDTTYESKAAEANGSEVSLVTTGEKHNWNNKVDKVTGKQLSTEDYTNAEKIKLGKISSETWTITLTDGTVITRKVCIMSD